MNKYKKTYSIIAKLCEKTTTEIFSRFINRCNVAFTNEIPLAGISYTENHFTIVLSDDYFKLPEAQQIGIMAHEIIHMMYRHPIMYRDRLRDNLLQVAMDMFINQIVTEVLGKDSLPKEGVHIDDFIKAKILTEADRDKDTLYYYKKLKEKAEKVKVQVKHQWESFGKMSEIEVKIEDLNIDRALKGIGNVPNAFRGLEVQKRESKIDYKRILERFLMNSFFTEQEYSYSYMNKRYSEFPGAYEREIPSLFVTIDTSASLSQKDINETFDQIDKIFRLGCKVDILESDCAITKEAYEYTGTRPTKMSGGGGTDFNPAIGYFNNRHKKYGAMIYLTDGHASTPNKFTVKPLLWILTSGTSNTVESMKNQNFKGGILKLNYE